jgi:hypothetical protein
VDQSLAQSKDYLKDNFIVITKFDLPFNNIPLIIILGWKWSQTNLETKILLRQLGSFSFGWTGVCCSHQVPNVFLKMFPIASHFHPICFAQNFPLFTYIIGPNGRHYVYIIFYCDELPKFQLIFFLFFCDRSMKIIQHS